jgi:peptidoglycan/LPS O-acetylase OafA/YrhL
MRLRYLPALDGVRACAFALVFVAHSGLEGAVPGGLGVTIFFFLSGYLITTLMRAEWAGTGTISLTGFYKRRALRILPPLYLVMLIGWMLDWFHIPTHQADSLGLFSILFYFYNYAALLVHGTPDIIPSGLNVVWSLMIEEHFYLIFPFAFLLAKKRAIKTRRVALTLAAICMAVLLWRCVLVFHFHTSLMSPFSWTYAATDARFDSILWGCVMAVGFNPWCGDTSSFLDRRRGELALAGAAMVFLTLVWREPHFRETLRYTLQGIAMLPIFYFIVSVPGSWLGKALSWPPVRWLGWVSYTMYLCHFMVLHILHDYLRWNGWLIGLVALAIAGIFAELVRQCLEKPLQRLKRKKHLEVAVNS